MENFDSAWLAMREPADAAARSEELAGLMASALATRDHVRAVDLASGTGANVRFLIPRLPHPQRWILADQDRALLAEASRSLAAWGRSHAYAVEHRDHSLELRGAHGPCRIDTRTVNLAGADGLAALDGQDFVSASALLDLVSAEWLRTLLSRCRDTGAAVLFALSYDGRLACTPEESDDEIVHDLVNRHQRGDKGFGPALGPAAAGEAAATLESLGYVVRQAASDWVLPPESDALQARLISGWAHAAAEMPGADAGAVAAWRARRLAHVTNGRSELLVGHRDLAAWLP